MVVGDQDALFHGRVLRRKALPWLRALALLLLAILMTHPLAPLFAAEREPLTLTGPVDALTFGQHLEYTIDTDWQMTVDDLLDPSRVEMRPLPGRTADFGYTPARIWLRLPVVNRADGEAWRLLFHANFTQKIAVYRVASDGSVATLLDLTEDSPFGARPIASPQMVAPFDLATGESATLVIAYYSQGSSRLSMSIETPDSLAALTGKDAAKSFAFYGMMLVMIALATLATAVLRQPVFAAYAAYVASVLLYVAHADGTAFQYLWPNLPRFNSMASVVAGSSVMVSGALFAITFLQTGRYHPILHRVLQTVILAVLAIDAALWWTDPQLLKRLLVIMLSINALTFLSAGLIAARTRFREVRFYLLAWLAGLIPAALFTARYGFGFEPSFITTYDAVRLALLFDALMMGLAIFDSYNHLRRTAMEETLAHAQRNLAMSQRLASLEQSYAKATTLAQQREESVKDTVHDLRQPMHALRLSFRQMFSAEGGRVADAGQVESALGYMERLVAERLADEPKAASAARPVQADASEAAPPGKGPVPNEPGVHGVLRGVADMFAPEAAEKGIALKLVLAAPDAGIAAYPLMRVMANLVSNAIKYTRQGEVLIGLRRKGEGLMIEVHDTGPGLKGAAFEKALVRNNRLERDRDAAEGSGLGLSVAKEIADANGWTITSHDSRRSGASIRVGLGASARA